MSQISPGQKKAAGRRGGRDPDITALINEEELIRVHLYSQRNGH